MLRELESLEKSRIVAKYEILDFKGGEDFYFLKLKVKLIDGSVLYLPIACKTPSVRGGWVRFKYSEDVEYNDLVTAVRLDGP